ncbi:gluconate:H+ symporter [Breoghania sp.]|uniref:gluconate:H+ symporter n=1 Tax=Breoghania sp. TaxID=2065378 RepID=UPI002AAC44F4|nr:gluconate:H+ symporter [Breoghania sp.]
MPLFIVAIGIAVLLMLIMRLKLNTFVALMLVSFGVAVALGVPLEEVVKAIEKGLGGTLGHIALIFGIGAMLGRLLADAGGAHRIALTLIERFGEKRVEWAVIVASFIVGVALFFEVGLVLLVPLVYTMAKEMRISLLRLGVPMVAALLATHCFLPPHPGPTVIAGEYGADIGKVLLYGIIIAIPTVIVCGPVFNRLAMRLIPDAYAKFELPEGASASTDFKLEETPGFGISVLTAMLPVILMAASTIVTIAHGAPGDSQFFTIIDVVGDASVAMVLSLIFAFFTMGVNRNIPVEKIMGSCASAANHIGMMLLIIGGGGAFKQVLIVGGVGDYIAQLFQGSHASPVLFAWVVAAILRISLGSATVAAISTAGLVIPVLAQTPADLALVTLATGAGSAICSHVNDAGFWMYKEFFGLSMKETFATWTLMSTFVSVMGLLVILLIEALTIV